MMVPLSPVLVERVFAQMRDADRAEAEAMLPAGVTLAEMGRAHGMLSTVGRVALDGTTPAAAIGAFRMWPGVWSVWMIATDAWPRVWRAVFRYAATTMQAEVRALGAHRIQAWAMEGHAEAARFLSHLGLERRVVEPGFGAGGEAFALWARSEVA